MEPDFKVTQDQVLAILGAKEVEIQILRQQLSQAQAKIVELTPKNLESPA